MIVQGPELFGSEARTKILVALALLGELRSFSASESAALERFVRPEVFNVAGRVVGVLRARIPDTILRVGPS